MLRSTTSSTRGEDGEMLPCYRSCANEVCRRWHLSQLVIADAKRDRTQDFRLAIVACGLIGSTLYQ